MSGRRLVIVFVLVAASFAVYLGLDKPGLKHSDKAMAGMGQTPSAAGLGVDDFASRITAPDAFVVNVHAPADKTIVGTDATIAYDRIATDKRLPHDKATPLLVYCKTGRMSKAAVKALIKIGYLDVSYLDGGLDSWVAAGKPVA